MKKLLVELFEHTWTVPPDRKWARLAFILSKKEQGE